MHEIRDMEKMAAAAAHKTPLETIGMDLRLEVRWFAELMEMRLRENDFKGGWHRDSAQSLLDRLREETQELEEQIAIPYSNPNLVAWEAADVANFALMLATNAVRSD